MESSVFGVPGVDGWVFAGLSVASFITTFIGVVTGTAGGLVLLAIMAFVFPPAILIPVHTVVQLGAGATRTAMMWRYVVRGTLLPFLAGSVIGAAIGAQIFVTLTSATLYGLLGGFILVLAWLPKLARLGPQRGRFVFVGFGATFLGVFVSATGTLLAPFVASAVPDRRNHAATMSSLMSIVHVTKLIAFAWVGIAIGAYTPLMVAMIATAALGNWVGAVTLDYMPERAFRLLFQVVLTVLAVRLLWLAAVEAGLL